jgi:hypothetical protein
MTLQRTVTYECDLCIARGEKQPELGEPLPLGPIRGRTQWLDVCKKDRSVYDMLRGLWEKYGRTTEVVPVPDLPGAASAPNRGWARDDADRGPDGQYWCPVKCGMGPWGTRAVWREHLRALHPAEAATHRLRVPSRYSCPDCPGVVLTGHMSWYAHRNKEHGKLRGSEPLPPRLAPTADDDPPPAPAPAPGPLEQLATAAGLTYAPQELFSN